MDCEGIVTDINSDYFYFELNNVTRIHMSILLSQNKLQKMPKLGSKASIKNAHRQGSVYVVGKDAELNGDFSIDYVKNAFLRLVKKLKFSTADLCSVDEIINCINKHFTNLEEHIKVNIVRCLLRNIHYAISFSDDEYSDDTCENENTRISECNIITLNSCRYVEIQSDKFKEFPYWSFGVHSNLKKTFLFGSLEIQPHYGLLLLTDSHYHLPMIIYNASSKKVHQVVIDKYLSIEKYRVITEIYKQSNVPNIEYLLVDFDDINIIYSNKCAISLFGDILPSDRTFINSMHFQIIRKSMVRIGDNNLSQCWFEILIKHPRHVDSSLEEAYFIVPSNYVRIVINFEEGLHYTLYYNKPLKKTINMELTRVKNLTIYELAESDGFFVNANETDAYKENILSVEECKNYVVDKTGLVSFHGILKFKKFRNALASRTSKRTNIYGFGTPGDQVHQLVFQDIQSQNIYLDCYLNNWENVLMPLGLIPHMWVIVRNVYPQSKKYVKSSVFTTFEIKSYDPPVNFETVNLYQNDKLNWGRSFFLGHGNHIPTGVLIWGRIYNIYILKVTTARRCIRCNNIQKLGSCIRCKISDTKLDFLTTMHVSDEFGQSKVLAKFPGIMKTLLNLQDYQYQRWLMAFDGLGEYEYNSFEEKYIIDETPARAFFRTTVTDFIKLFNKQGMPQLDLKCRKLDSNPRRYGGRPLWLCVDARSS